MFDPKPFIRTVPDWPKQGIAFRDVTTLMSDPTVFKPLIEAFIDRYKAMQFDAVAGIDARGFIIGAPLAYALEKAFVPIRKKGKLPFNTFEEAYELEYGHAELQIHQDALKSGQRVLIVDDLIATGGTLEAACKLIEQCAAEVVECAAIVDLPDLGGTNKALAKGYSVFTLCAFDGD